ncbi:MAG: hypothetical protein ACFFD2_13445, partial [Promethearchaeota archaeon]
MIEHHNICGKCILPAGFLGVQLDSNGLCGFCTDPNHKNINWSRTVIGKHRRKQAVCDWNMVVADMKNNHGKVKYDCVLGYSGGKDSTALVDYLVHDLGVNPLLVTCDSGFMTKIAKDNITDTLQRVKVDHIFIEDAVNIFTK